MRKLTLICTTMVVGLTAMAQMSPEEALRQAAKHEKEGSFRRARTIYENFLRDHPQHIQSLNVKYRLGICHDNIGETDKAIKTFKEVVGAGQDKHFKHRSETVVKLAKLLGASAKHQEAVDYLPLHKAFRSFFERAGGEEGYEPGLKLDDPKGPPIFRNICAHNLLGKSYDDISRKHGMRLTTDTAHLNSVSAGLITDLALDYIRTCLEPE